MGLFRFLFWDHTCPIDMIGLCVCLPPSSSLNALLQSCVDHFGSSRSNTTLFPHSFLLQEGMTTNSLLLRWGHLKDFLCTSQHYESLFPLSICLLASNLLQLSISELSTDLSNLVKVGWFKSYLAGDEGIDPPLCTSPLYPPCMHTLTA